MKKSRLIWIIAVYAVIIVLFIGLSPKKIIWKDYFQAKKRAPYGSYILFQEMDQIFSDFSTEDKSLYQTLKDSTAFKGNYIFVTNNFYPSEVETKNLLAWVAQGNTAFIAASAMSFNLLDTLNLELDWGYDNWQEILEDQLQVNLTTAKDENLDRSYPYKKQNLVNQFIDINDSLGRASKLSFIDNEYHKDKAIMVAKKFGQGKFLLHSLPHAFTNYYMLHEDNHEYAAGVLSYLPDVQTKWDEYYKPYRKSEKAPMSVFLETKAFRWAFYVGMALFTVFLVFKMKRNQRIIPIIKAPENRSLELTKTVGDLYFHTDDKLDLVQKMERHFREYLKERFFIHNFKGTEDEIKLLAIKSGKTEGLISTLHNSFKQLENSEITSENLIRLSQKLHIFYYGREQQ